MIQILKTAYRLFRYRAEWKKQWREIFIKQQQNQSISKQFNVDAETLIVFLTVGADYYSGKDSISGGMISIISLAEESQKLFQSSSVAVVSCTKNFDHLLFKFTKFDNQTIIYRFSQLKKTFKKPQKIVIHIPELFVEEFQNSLTDSDKKWMSLCNMVHFNILNQSINLMPNKIVVNHLKSLAGIVTITTAHQQYCTQDMCNYYEVPVHKFSVWISPENYTYQNWEEKENIIAFSPDPYQNKNKIETELKEKLPGYTIVTIKNLTYTEYKKLISKAKFVITFGEGLDGYFLEPIFSGCISFAVYNELFFTSDYKKLNNIFSSYEDLESGLIQKIKEYDNLSKYKAINSSAFEVCAMHYSYKTYRKNIELFYDGNYTFK